MATTWTIAVDWERNGDFTGTYDNVTSRVMDARWFIGARKPYQDVGDEAMLSLTLDNSDKRYSPEYASSPLYGYLVPFRPVRIQSNDGTTTRTHYTGWIEKIEPEVNHYGKRTIKLVCSGAATLFLASAETNLEIQENKRTDEIIDALLNEIVLPPALIGNAIIDLPSSIINSVNIVDGQMPRTLQQGKTTLAYAADNWIKRGNEGEEVSSFSIYRAIKDAVAAERGRFFFDREGEAIFWHRHHLITNLTLQATFDNSMTEMEYSFAGLGEFANDITVTCHPRTVSAGNNELLWELDEPMRLQPGQEREIGAPYRDDSDNRIGGRNVTLANVTYNTGTNFSPVKVVFKEKGANRSVLHVRNEGNKVAELQTCEVRGQKITDFGRMEAHVKDDLSIVKHGRRDMRLDLQSIDGQDDAQAIADFELARRKTPSGKVATLTVRSHGKNGGNQHAYQLARTIGDRIKIIESQTGHTGEYFIIGEEHKLSEQATLYETTWYLESATEGDWFVIDTNEVNSSAVLVPY
jgi:hypothetical protein